MPCATRNCPLPPSDASVDLDLESCQPTTQPRTPEILCIDDDPEISRCIEMHLREYQVRVQRAYFGMQGFWEATTCHPDLIIMDLAMPNGDGRFVLESLRGNPRAAEIPVIVLSGMRDKLLRQELFSLGANQFLNKPLKFDELLHEITRFIDIRKRSDQEMGSREKTETPGTKEP